MEEEVYSFKGKSGRPGEVSERATVWGKTFEVFSLEMGVVENGDDLSSPVAVSGRTWGSSTYAGAFWCGVLA